MTNVFRKCPGMEVEFVSGKLERDVAERAIFYEFKVNLKLDFLNFLVMANQFIPNYLESRINAIRPELSGLAYHISYQQLMDAAGNIRDSQALFNLFNRPSDYLDVWSSNGATEQRYAKPTSVSPVTYFA
ncbi:hypothetical protein [Pseudomonas fluorescens]|uniref:Uncharacterized protein n=1 Tax=Pseudomonas fluorescens (strain Pf0-1) TaxID=205922 RepID=Q3KG05_PSEPF|nr:hypothetical protein [Pseudomonas fluorescens]ABA73301.1 hypothetical protein Pfl01_1558 [Pseudomonas fluorescens Pf0-1]